MITLDLPRNAAAGRSRVELPALRGFLLRARKAVPVAGMVSVLLTGDAGIRRLNRQYRGKNTATDVLSFPAHAIDSGIAVAGDLAISLETAARQARRFGHSTQTEVKILILHGLLHLAGFDHERDAGEMARAEESLRRRFRLPKTLIARAATAAPGRRGRRP